MARPPRFNGVRRKRTRPATSKSLQWGRAQLSAESLSATTTPRIHAGIIFRRQLAGPLVVDRGLRWPARPCAVRVARQAFVRW
jgi:hypothetical protein